ncbi:unnamed protein product [Thelazia callipaeda]|uniref:Prion protein n=1 Tax=Thelazia callipaeda TaxID=103827 RepID=A0A0N5DB60_THECL|nr:unnamed protein product [Thelazia callipaeda]
MYQIIFCLILITHGVIDARKISVGGKNRGSSAARTNVQSGGTYHAQQNGYYPQHGNYPSNQPGVYRPNQPNVYHPNQAGGYHANQAGGYHPNQAGGYHPQAGYVPNQMKFNPGMGAGTKSSSMGTFKKALIGGAIGAAAGLATFELGKAILRSHSQPLQAPNGQNYYFDESNHQSKNGFFMCSMPLDEVVKAVQESSSQTPKDDSKNSTDITPEQFFKTVNYSYHTNLESSYSWN